MPEYKVTKEQIADAFRRRAAQDAALGAVDSDSVALVNEIAALMREWVPGAYAVGDLRMYADIPRRCVQAHDSTANPLWTPEVASLWMEYHGTSVETARPYKPPAGAHDAYQVDEFMIWTDGAIYRCKVPNTVHDPGVLPGSWSVVGGSGEPEQPVVDEYPAWVQPTGAHDAYAIGDKVSHKGKRWVCNTPNCVWEPGSYGWIEEG